MKPILEVSIDGHLFHFDMDADARLKHYLSVFKQKIFDDSGSEEVMTDINARIAELIMNAQFSSEQVVQLSLIDEIIAQLGLPDGSKYQIPNGETHSSRFSTQSSGAYNPSPDGKRLFRIKEGKTVAGVCKGISEYFQINLALIRLIFLVALIIGSLGFWIYIILWIALPSKQRSSEPELTFPGNRIFRDRMNKRLAGVCSGLAYYFQVDVAIIYTLFIVGIFFGGSTIAIYIILWITIPYAKTPAEKCELYNIPPTAENLAHFSKV